MLGFCVPGVMHGFVASDTAGMLEEQAGMNLGGTRTSVEMGSK